MVPGVKITKEGRILRYLCSYCADWIFDTLNLTCGTSRAPVALQTRECIASEASFCEPNSSVYGLLILISYGNPWYPYQNSRSVVIGP